MAGEVSHVIYAARALNYIDGAAPAPLFWAGTLFPDIMHLDVASRRRTHLEGVSLESLLGSGDFETGMRVHAWVDQTREQFLRDIDAWAELPWHPFVQYALELVEDEALYERFDDWNLIHRSLNRIYDEEVLFVNSRERVSTWHGILQNYFREKPDSITRHDLSLALGLTENSAEEVGRVVALLQKDKRALGLIDRIVQHIELLLQ
jgi:hypothetical protein